MFSESSAIFSSLIESPSLTSGRPMVTTFPRSVRRFILVKVAVAEVLAASLVRMRTLTQEQSSRPGTAF